MAAARLGPALGLLSLGAARARAVNELRAENRLRISESAAKSRSGGLCRLDEEPAMDLRSVSSRTWRDTREGATAQPADAAVSERHYSIT